MASWILNFTKGGAKLKKQMPQQARELLEVGLWGVPATAQAKDKIAGGDRVLAYVGAPDRVFIGEAVVGSGWHAWAPDEVARYPMTARHRGAAGTSRPAQVRPMEAAPAIWGYVPPPIAI